jgi:DNA-directed RNA polymerase specialized sigma subunit
MSPPRPSRREHPYAITLRAQARREAQARTRAQTQLRERDRMILEGIAQGMTWRECAEICGVSIQRVSQLVRDEKDRVQAREDARRREEGVFDEVLQHFRKEGQAR